MRFDETYRQGGKFTLYTCAPWMVAFGKPTREVFGKSVSPFALFFQGDSSSVLYEKSRFDAVACAAADSLSDPFAFDALYSKWLSVAQKLESLSWDVFSGRKADFRPYWDTFVDFWKYSVFIDCFDAGVDFDRMGALARRFDLSKEDVQLLTTPVELSYLQDLEKNASLAALGRLSSGEFLRQFYWYPTNYVEYGAFDSESAETVVVSFAPKAGRTLALLEESRLALEDRQRKILETKGLNRNPLWLYQRLVAWRDLRKRFNFAGLYGFDTLAQDALKENGIRTDLFVALWPQELLDENLPSQKELENRKKFGVLALVGVDSFELLSGPAAKRTFTAVDSKTRSASVLELRGQPACLGRVTAPVRIVHAPSDLFLEGEILVTAMTRPEYVPLMKKAAGILTDEGGITSHAAVVSRELNKPCIVGTQTATLDLKTGDMVDLDAFHGLARKVSFRSHVPV